MNLSYYKNLAHDHWKEFLPQLYEELIATGELNKALAEAAKQTDLGMQQALDAGIPRDQAWEGIRGRYLLLEPEEDSQEESPDRPLARLSREIFGAINDIYDNL